MPGPMMTLYKDQLTNAEDLVLGTGPGKQSNTPQLSSAGIKSESNIGAGLLSDTPPPPPPDLAMAGR